LTKLIQNLLLFSMFVLIIQQDVIQMTLNGLKF
jgi:hypothetical protein